VPASEPRFLQVAHAFVGGEAPVGTLIALQERAAFVDVDDSSVAIVIWPSLRGDELLEGINEVLDRDRHTHLKLLIVGGGDDMRGVLERVRRPALSRRAIQTFHLRDDGEVWAGKDSWLSSPFGQRLLAVAPEPVPADVIDRRGLAAMLPPPMDPEERERAIEHVQFIDRFRKKKTWVTYGLVAFIAATFGLEELWGSSELVPTLVRMGANVQESLTHEPWRLLASASLHAGLVHFALNSVVLVILGRFLEKILGWERFAVLYVASAAAGALASAIAFPFSEASLSVGASGAIWGFLGAAAALAWRPGNILPRNLVGPLRRTAVINLVINLSVSFLPQVDLWAHLGGGIAGALLILSGVLTHGLGESDGKPTRWRFVASTALAILVASLVVGIVRGEPWRLTEAPTYHRISLPEAGVEIEIPVDLSGPVLYDHDDGQVDLVLGSAFEDPYAVVVTLLPHAQMTEAEIEQAREEFLDSKLEAPAGTRAVGERQIVADARYPTYEERFVAPSGLRITIRSALMPQGRVVTEVVDWRDADPAYGEAAQRIVQSVRALH
jgi:membrane associated rhomboid family serine protease